MTFSMMKRPFLAAALSAVIVLGGCTSSSQRPAPSSQHIAVDPPPVMSKGSTYVPKGVIPDGAASVKVALLVPLSGESLAVGNAMMDAASMAVYDAYMGAPSNQIKAQIILLPKDTGNTPASAARAAQQAIDQGAKIIIGPLFSQSVKNIAPMAKAAGVTMITFSNNKAVAEDGVYTFGFLPEQQVERMAEYTYLHSLQRVAVLAPNDSYGEKVQATLKQEFHKRGGVVSPSELYAPSPANIDAAVSRLAASYTNASDDRKFQAIFIADGGTQLKNIIASLKKTTLDLSKIKLLGTGLWDDPEIAKIPEMQGAWFPSAPPKPYAKFERHFMAMYGYKPVRLASLAYDAVALTISLVMNSPGGHVSKDILTDSQGYISPANSLFRLRRNGISERKLCIMEITPSGFKVIDLAPKVFEKP